MKCIEAALKPTRDEPVGEIITSNASVDLQQFYFVNTILFSPQKAARMSFQQAGKVF